MGGHSRTQTTGRSRAGNGVIGKAACVSMPSCRAASSPQRGGVLWRPGFLLLRIGFRRFARWQVLTSLMKKARLRAFRPSMVSTSGRCFPGRTRRRRARRSCSVRARLGIRPTATLLCRGTSTHRAASRFSWAGAESSHERLRYVCKHAPPASDPKSHSHALIAAGKCICCAARATHCGAAATGT